MTRLRRIVTSGLIFVFPLLVTLFVLAWVYQRLAAIPMPFGPPYSVLLAIALFVCVALSLGYLMRTAMGELFESRLDDLMNRVPGLRVVYNASKIAAETALTDQTELQEPVKLEVWEGRRMTAFKTGKSTGDGRDILFLPTAPNIASGFVIEVDPDAYEPSNERVEDALTRILSAGFGDHEEEVPQLGLPGMGSDPEGNGHAADDAVVDVAAEPDEDRRTDASGEELAEDRDTDPSRETPDDDRETDASSEEPGDGT